MIELPAYVLALDVSSSRMGIAEGRVGAAPTFSSVSFARDGEGPEDACARAMLWAAERFRAFKPDWLFIEAPIEGGGHFHRDPQTSVLLWGLYFNIAAVAKNKSIQTRRANVRTVRAHFIGNGNMPGKDAKRAVAKRCKQLGWEPKNDDESDAGAVWDYACSRLRPAQLKMQLVG